MKKLICSLVILFAGVTSSMAYEYPTEETVRYVLNCMTALGGQTEPNLYTCSCRYDATREAMAYDDYDGALTYERNKAMPGEKGGFFRDNDLGAQLYETLLQAREAADSNCIVVKQVKRIEPTSTN
mgnify:FL=1